MISLQSQVSCFVCFVWGKDVKTDLGSPVKRGWATWWKGWATRFLKYMARVCWICSLSANSFILIPFAPVNYTSTNTLVVQHLPTLQTSWRPTRPPKNVVLTYVCWGGELATSLRTAI